MKKFNENLKQGVNYYEEFPYLRVGDVLNQPDLTIQVEYLYELNRLIEEVMNNTLTLSMFKDTSDILMSDKYRYRNWYEVLQTTPQWLTLNIPVIEQSDNDPFTFFDSMARNTLLLVFQQDKYRDFNQQVVSLLHSGLIGLSEDLITRVSNKVEELLVRRIATQYQNWKSSHEVLFGVHSDRPDRLPIIYSTSWIPEYTSNSSETTYPPQWETRRIRKGLPKIVQDIMIFLLIAIVAYLLLWGKYYHHYDYGL